MELRVAGKCIARLLLCSDMYCQLASGAKKIEEGRVPLIIGSGRSCYRLELTNGS